MPSTLQTNGLYDTYHVPGFITQKNVRGIFGDSKAIVLKLVRRQKKRPVECVALCTQVSMTERNISLEICPVAIEEYIWKWRFVVCTVPGAQR